MYSMYVCLNGSTRTTDPRSLHDPVPVYQRQSDYPDIIALVSPGHSNKCNTTGHTF